MSVKELLNLFIDSPMVAIFRGDNLLYFGSFKDVNELLLGENIRSVNIYSKDCMQIHLFYWE